MCRVPASQITSEQLRREHSSPACVPGLCSRMTTLHFFFFFLTTLHFAKLLSCPPDSGLLWGPTLVSCLQRSSLTSESR